MESFFRTHKYLVQHLAGDIPRLLMEQIRWDSRLVAIKGTRGVGKTTFLLQYAKKYFNPEEQDCLYVNLNHFYFAKSSIISFAKKFVEHGGKTLLLDQIYKYPNWVEELHECYEQLPDLKIVFTASTVMTVEEEARISKIVDIYNLRGFSYREFLNILFDKNFRAYSLEEIISDHENIVRTICSEINPMEHLWDYQHHGYYPFFLEKKNFSENLLKTINMMLEVDVLLIRQIEHSYLPKLRKLLYLLANIAPGKPNISQLSIDCDISRATVTNYLECLKSARLINMLYKEGDEFPKKPELVYLHNTNLMYPLKMAKVEDQALRETFFYNQVHHSDWILNKGQKNGLFNVSLNNKRYKFKIEESKTRRRKKTDIIQVVDNVLEGSDNMIPLWIFGFLY